MGAVALPLPLVLPWPSVAVLIAPKDHPERRRCETSHARALRRIACASATHSTLLDRTL